MNKKGQALVEFVLILPTFLLLIFAFIDIGRIIICKNHLESTLSEVSILVLSDKNEEEIREYVKNDNSYDMTLSINEGKYTKISLTTDIELITPIMNKVLDNPYNILVERSIINE